MFALCSVADEAIQVGHLAGLLRVQKLVTQSCVWSGCREYGWPSIRLNQAPRTAPKWAGGSVVMHTHLQNAIGRMNGDRENMEVCIYAACRPLWESWEWTWSKNPDCG